MTTLAVILIIIAAFNLIGIGINTALVGRPRKPTTPGVIVTVNLISLAVITVEVLAAIALIHSA